MHPTIITIKQDLHALAVKTAFADRHGWSISPRRLIAIMLLALNVSAVPAQIVDSGVARVQPLARLETNQPSAEFEHAIEQAKGYLLRSAGPNGRFVYHVDLASGMVGPSYNIVRHSGAMYALGLLYGHQGDPQIAAVLVETANFMRQRYVANGPEGGQLAVWSEPATRISDAYLGATGLGLVALAETNSARPHSVSVAEMQALGRFVLSMQRKDGSFYSKYGVGTGPDPNWESLYYPGEAALGLLALYEADHSRAWLEAAAEALTYLARSRHDLADVNVPRDHWGLIATARLLQDCTKTDCPFSRAALVAYAVQVCRSLMRGQLQDPPDPALDGAFDITGRTTPTATRMEGLLAALEFLPEKEEASLREQIADATTRGVRFLLRAQIRSGPYAGGLPGATAPEANDDAEIRIDFVQHAICAWLRYEDVVLHVPPGSH